MTPRCVPGAAVACICENGKSGAQRCEEGGQFGLCVCRDRLRDGGTGRESTTELVSDAGLPQENGAPDVLVEREQRTREVLSECAGSDRGGTGKSLGVGLFRKLAGLWVGAASGTSLGNFPLMVMDFRAASSHVLFGRVDLDAKNFLRFAFSIETHKGKDVLVYRNGGFFLGILRDSRTSLLSLDASKSRWRFCAIRGGCDMIDATFSFPSETQLKLQVYVRKRQHLTWNAQRKESRILPIPFPKDLTSQGTGKAPFPKMPEAKVSVSWTTPIRKDADVWVILSTTTCGMTGLHCTASRSIKSSVKAGATSATLTFAQLHEGRYFVNAVLDRNRNIRSAPFPDSGDGVAIPDTPITVKPGASNASALQIVYTRP